MFTMDVIASTAFGLKIDSQKDKNNHFVTMAKNKIFGGLRDPLVLIIRKYIQMLV